MRIHLMTFESSLTGKCLSAEFAKPNPVTFWNMLLHVELEVSLTRKCSKALRAIVLNCVLVHFSQMFAKNGQRNKLIAMLANFSFLVRGSQVFDQMKFEILDFGQSLGARRALEPLHSVMNEGMIIKPPNTVHGGIATRTRQSNLCFLLELGWQDKIGLSMSDIMLHKFLDRFASYITTTDVAFPFKSVVMLNMVGKVVIIRETFVAMLALEWFF